MRMKPERASVARDKHGNVPMVLLGSITEEQKAARAEIARKVVKNTWSNDTFIPANSVRQYFGKIALPSNMDNIYLNPYRNSAKSL